MKVYVLLMEIVYEGETILDIYLNKKDAMDDLEAKENSQRVYYDAEEYDVKEKV